MPLFLDARLPVRFGTLQTRAKDAALLLEGDAPVPPQVPVARFVLPPDGLHASGCPCCTPRGPVSGALGRLFLARARGETPFFRVVVAVPLGARGYAAICSALEQDPLVSARYRLDRR
jgi:hypothetical protein